MEKEHQIVAQVYAAKADMQKADALIRAYIPFIRSETSKFLSRLCTNEEDEFSIGMIAFHEAILGYAKERGAFLSYASMLIRSRLIDYARREEKHRGHVSLSNEGSREGQTLLEELEDDRNQVEELNNREATRQEIEELSRVMESFGIRFADVAENSPRQERTMEACHKAIRFAGENTGVLDELLKTKKLPMAALVSGSGVERKTLERHRRYILAMLLIQTNGYELIRGHLYHVLKKGGGKQV